LAFLTASASFAEPVRNGNDLALMWVEADSNGKAAIVSESDGVIHTFRYMQIEEIRTNSLEHAGWELSTREPSSEIKVVLIVSGAKSLKLARTLREGDCVAVKGRIYPSTGPGDAGFSVRPAVLRHKDKCLPKRGKELRREVDPAAH